MLMFLKMVSGVALYFWECVLCILLHKHLSGTDTIRRELESEGCTEQHLPTHTHILSSKQSTPLTHHLQMQRLLSVWVEQMAASHGHTPSQTLVKTL